MATLKTRFIDIPAAAPADNAAAAAHVLLGIKNAPIMAQILASLCAHPTDPLRPDASVRLAEDMVVPLLAIWLAVPIAPPPPDAWAGHPVARSGSCWEGVAAVATLFLPSASHAQPIPLDVIRTTWIMLPCRDATVLDRVRLWARWLPTACPSAAQVVLDWSVRAVRMDTDDINALRAKGGRLRLSAGYGPSCAHGNPAWIPYQQPSVWAAMRADGMGPDDVCETRSYIRSPASVMTVREFLLKAPVRHRCARSIPKTWAEAVAAPDQTVGAQKKKTTETTVAQSVLQAELLNSWKILNEAGRRPGVKDASQMLASHARLIAPLSLDDIRDEQGNHILMLAPGAGYKVLIRDKSGKWPTAWSCVNRAGCSLATLLLANDHLKPEDIVCRHPVDAPVGLLGSLNAAILDGAKRQTGRVWYHNTAALVTQEAARRLTHEQNKAAWRGLNAASGWCNDRQAMMANLLERHCNALVRRLEKTVNIPMSQGRTWNQPKIVWPDNDVDRDGMARCLADNLENGIVAADAGHDLADLAPSPWEKAALVLALNDPEAVPDDWHRNMVMIAARATVAHGMFSLGWYPLDPKEEHPIHGMHHAWPQIVRGTWLARDLLEALHAEVPFWNAASPLGVLRDTHAAYVAAQNRMAQRHAPRP